MRNEYFVYLRDVEKSSKMKKLLGMLQNPQRRMPMDTLLKSEHVLMKLEIRDERTSAPPNMESRIAALTEAVNNALKTPSGAHTLNRTFSPALSVLLGPTYTANPTKRFKRDNPLQPLPETPNISDVIQGEVARLNTRFRVNLDCQQPPGSEEITLICQLDDPNLPCVPPITFTIPSAYPLKTPRCDLLPVDYETTDFLKNIRETAEHATSLQSHNDSSLLGNECSTGLSPQTNSHLHDYQCYSDQ